MIKYFCDRCGAEIGNYNISEIFEVTVRSPAAIRADDVKIGSYMFCYECVRELNKFIEQEELVKGYAAERECTCKEIIIEALTEYLDQTYHFPDLEEEE